MTRVCRILWLRLVMVGLEPTRRLGSWRQETLRYFVAALPVQSVTRILSLMCRHVCGSLRHMAGQWWLAVPGPGSRVERFRSTLLW
jgi:hypothetical protein